MSNDLTPHDEDAIFEEIFFKTHGVGDSPVERELQIVRHQIDASQATFKEYQFCKFIVNGDKPVDAYIKAFEFTGTELTRKTFAAHAKKLLERPRVAKAMFEIKKKMHELVDEDLANLVSELNEAKELARDLAKPEAMINAVKAKANLLGLENPKSQSTHIHVDLSEEQKKKMFERMKKRMFAFEISDDIDDADIIEG